MPSRTEVFAVEGMHCGACSAAVERSLNRIPGVEASVSLPAETATVRITDDGIDFDRLAGEVEAAGFLLARRDSAGDRAERERQRLEREAEKVRTAKRRMILAWSLTIPIMLWMIPEMGFGILWPTPLLFELGLMLLAIPVVVGPGRDTLRSGISALARRSPNMDSLIALGSGAAVVTGLFAVSHRLGFGPMIMNYAGVGAMIMAIHLTGRFVETRARGRTSAAIQKLLALEPRTARVERAGVELELPIAEVRVGDEMIVRPGEKVPTDGVVIEGTSAVDESLATGESIPVDKVAGDPVIGATINRQGSLRVRATGVGEDTFLAGVVRMVEQAQGSKVPIQEFADRVTAVFVPIVLAIATLTLVAWLGFPDTFRVVAERAAELLPWVHPDLSRVSLAVFAALAVLVIACPCALGLATPTALMVGTGMGAENGVLIRDGAAIQVLEGAEVIVFDKTGTVTRGAPELTAIRPAPGFEESELLGLAGALEDRSEHPLGAAIVTAAKERLESLPAATAFEAVPGMGVVGNVGGRDVRVGSRRLLARDEIPTDDLVAEAALLEDEGQTVMFVAVDGEPAGLIAVADRVKADSREAIQLLHELGLETVMLTGDNARTAAAVGASVGIEDVRAGLLPGDKVEAIREIQESGRTVAMVGDGINDAPSLTRADVGIAIGTGTDIAIESADMIVVQGSLMGVVKAVRLSRATFRKIRQNLFWAYFYNTIAIPIAVLGLLHPILAEAAMAGSSITVVANANSLRRAPIDG
ncbi:MAG: heavy metal translocating P-type ATPase [marine benthic group bacterium]|nr:heavy metal translocating P-type ATPase [Gemmatimonadota bacterium]